MSNKSQTHEEIYQNIEGIKTILKVPNTVTTTTNRYFYVPVNQIYTGTPVNLNKTEPILLRQANPYLTQSSSSNLNMNANRNLN